MKKKIFIIATEPSGDLLGSKLISSLKKKDNNIQFFGVGGDMMKSVGFKSIVPIKAIAVNGIIEVISKLSIIYSYFNLIINSIKNVKPDILITIDSPSFNLRLIKKIQFLRKKTQFVHYVAPTVWAWKNYRAKQFSKYYDKLLVLFEFEKKYFPSDGAKIMFVGHPVFYEKKECNNIESKKKILSFFPGSRLNEIKKALPIFYDVISNLKLKNQEIDFRILTIPALKNDVKNLLPSVDIQIISDLKEKKKIMSGTYLAIAMSGTISMELAHQRIPMIVVYKTNLLTYLLIKFLVKVKWCSLINIIFDKEIIPELLFNDFNSASLYKKIDEYLKNKELIFNQIEFFNDLPKKFLKQNKNPSKIAANFILD
tara:strand:+ start:38327 stop:39433 length:1107 start_codon:yes stop_codon:yes gene_type:complete